MYILTIIVKYKKSILFIFCIVNFYSNKYSTLLFANNNKLYYIVCMLIIKEDFYEIKPNSRTPWKAT